MTVSEIATTSIASLARRKVQGFGWIPDLPDHRDLLYPMSDTLSYPSSVDLIPGFPACYDQGNLGSCTANAIAGIIQYVQKQESIPLVMPSRLFIYYNERAMEGQVGQDAGAQIRDGIKSVVNLGACPEVPDWPYDITKFSVQPPAQAYSDALAGVVTKYMRVSQVGSTVFQCLANQHPFVGGITVYESFMNAAGGDIPMPSQSEKVLGGHAIVICGYDQQTGRFKFRNSWGSGWGQNGYGTLPFAYLLSPNLASDCWAIVKEK
jgi:C1A family cysteine protease